MSSIEITDDATFDLFDLDVASASATDGQTTGIDEVLAFLSLLTHPAKHAV